MRNKNKIPARSKVQFKRGDDIIVGYIGFYNSKSVSVFVPRNQYSSVKDWYEVSENELTRV